MCNLQNFFKIIIISSREPITLLTGWELGKLTSCLWITICPTLTLPNIILATTDNEIYSAVSISIDRYVGKHFWYCLFAKRMKSQLFVELLATVRIYSIQWRNQSERATWSTDQQAAIGTSYGEDELNPSPLRFLKENMFAMQSIDGILYLKCNFF